MVATPHTSLFRLFFCRFLLPMQPEGLYDQHKQAKREDTRKGIRQLLMELSASKLRI